jgi:hypothetical protein
MSPSTSAVTAKWTGWLWSISQNKVLERAKRTESEGKIGDVTWNVLKPAQRVVAFALYLPLL